MNPYLPILMILVVGILLGCLLTGLAAFMGPKRRTEVKREVFDCGLPAVTQVTRMSVKFYLTAILFILFDIETIFLFLWARVFRALGWFGMMEILVFACILVAGYVYVWRRKALEWE